MQQIDATAVDRLGIPRLLLMDHAGLAVATAALGMISRPDAALLLCCGSGFNGGDGLAAARHLLNHRVRLHLVLACRRTALRGEPAIFAVILQRLGLPFIEWEPGGAGIPQQVGRAMAEADLLVDALLGLGLRGPVREPTASLITLMNQSGKPILAVDLPSGLDGDTGAVHGVAARATTTVTFGRVKHGCLIGEGPAHTGALLVEPITFPRHLLEPTTA